MAVPGLETYDTPQTFQGLSGRKYYTDSYTGTNTGLKTLLPDGSAAFVTVDDAIGYGDLASLLNQGCFITDID